MIGRTCLTTSAQAREKRYAAQLARRKEILEVLSGRDKVSISRPKRYEEKGGIAGSEASCFSLLNVLNVLLWSIV